MAVPKPKARIERVYVAEGEEFELDWQDRVLAWSTAQSSVENPRHQLIILRRPGQ